MPRLLSQILVIVLTLVVGSMTSFAANDINANAGTSSFAFLKINVSARPVAMGGGRTPVWLMTSPRYFIIRPGSG